MKEKLHRSGDTGTVQFFCFTHFDLLYPKTHPKRVGNLDYKSINFSTKVRYNYVAETDQPRKGARPGPCEA